MNLLLVLPAMGFVLLQAIGQERSITQALVVAQTQVRLSHLKSSTKLCNADMTMPYRARGHTNLSVYIGVLTSSARSS